MIKVLVKGEEDTCTDFITCQCNQYSRCVLMLKSNTDSILTSDQSYWFIEKIKQKSSVLNCRLIFFFSRKDKTRLLYYIIMTGMLVYCIVLGVCVCECTRTVCVCVLGIKRCQCFLCQLWLQEYLL